jgi:hypothetical protein
MPPKPCENKISGLVPGAGGASRRAGLSMLAIVPRNESSSYVFG